MTKKSEKSVYLSNDRPLLNVKYAALVKDSDRIPALPSIAMQVISILQGETEWDGENLAAIIAKDQSMTAALLSRATSVLYGPQGLVQKNRPSSTVLNALARVGAREAAVTILEVCVENALPFPKGLPISHAGLFEHSRAVSLLAEKIGQRVPDAKIADLQIGALLHDLGLTVRAVLDPQGFANNKKDTSHDILGAAVCEKWQLPPLVCSIVEKHHIVDELDENLLLALPNEVLIVNLADKLINRLVACIQVYEHNEVVPDSVLKKLGLTPSVIVQLANEVQSIIRQDKLARIA